MKKVFLDTNILLDFILDRKPFSDEAEQIIQLRYTNSMIIFASALSLANVVYVIRKATKDPFLVLEGLMEWIHVIDLTKKEFDATLKSNFKDIEDGLQYYSAASVQAEAIITRNVNDFLASSIPVFTPSQFLKRLSS